MTNTSKKVSEYMSEIGKKGGKSLAKQRGPDHFRELQKRGTKAKLLKKKLSTGAN